MEPKEYAIAEFQALPLEYIIAAPLLGVIKAQAAAAAATQAYIQSLIDKDKGKPITVDLKLQVKKDNTQKEVEINAPLLSLVPVPHIRIDSFTTHFKYEISQVTKLSKELTLDAEGSANIVKNPIINFSLKGTVASKSSEESVMNRSGMLEITVHASEAPIPEGLSRLLNVLAKALPEE
ncbi:MAG: DUF2589 domain-containing protein [Bacteroidales bacterium]|nr:DUF2589 domain-containing protein [Bacteroidales bacterium]